MDPNFNLPPIPTHPTETDPAPPMITHPPYTEMITAAIAALKDKDGSSRQAISKFIEQKFTNLPPTHATLLTHHLKRLKTVGQLIMVKHSYMLPPPPGSTPRSAQFEQPSTGYYPHTLDFTTGNVSVDANLVQSQLGQNNGQNSAGFGMENSGSGLTKRKPGRPPKLKPVPGSGVQDQETAIPTYDGSASTYQPQFQHDAGAGQDFQTNYGPVSDFQENSGGGGGGGGSEPLFASLGLSDDGAAVAPPPPADNAEVSVKRGRGRPPRSVGGGSGGVPTQGQVAGDGQSQGQVAGDGQSQGQVAGDGQSQGNVAGDGSGEILGVETGGGMPLKKQKMMSVMRVKKARGRPKRIGVGPVTVPLSGNVLRPKGRPKRLVRPNVSVNGGVGEMGLGKRRGRPVGRPPVNKIANLTGKHFGRPIKGGLGTAVLVTDPRQLVVYQELKTKYELLQSKVKQVASVVKTCIDPDYGNAALGALQELEGLAGEVNAPSNGQTQEPTAPVYQN
ncbi:uncharacterized protein [Rutidosis leptorrhynchoides]|uniref:uncharacterized protein n=1 Tax=Rutidosis leptorrhynchoides TaxID=125765 RepID=UPI003A9A6124